MYSFPGHISHSLSSQVSIFSAGKCAAEMMPCAVCQTSKKSYSNHALRKCNYSPLSDWNLYPCTLFSANQVFFSFPSFSFTSHVLSDFPFQFRYFLLSSQLCLSLFFFFCSSFGFCEFFFTLDLIFFHFPPDIFSLFVLTCCSLFHCPLLSLSEDGKSNKDCFFFSCIYISRQKYGPNRAFV